MSMSVTADQERVKTLLTETIILLCKNGLHFKNEFTVEGLIGITIDKNDVFLINIKETIKLSNQATCTPIDNFNLKQTTRKRRYNSIASSNVHNLESDMSDQDHINRNTSCDDLSSSKCFSNSSNSPLDVSVHLNLPTVCSRPTCSNTAREDSVKHSSDILNHSDSHRGLHMADDPNILKDSDVKDVSSTGPNLIQNRPRESLSLPLEESKAYLNKKSSDSRDECDSNYFTTNVKEEVHDVDEVEVDKSPNSAVNQNNLHTQGNQLGYSCINYSLIDSSVTACPPLSHQSFHLYQNAEQNDQQVELLPGSGVYISMRAYVHLNKETWVRGSKLVRRVVREVFPDEHILARSSCLGRRLGGCHVGLDHHKVDTIKAFVQQRMPQVSHTEIVAAINECCRDIRAKLRKSYFRRLRALRNSFSPTEPPVDDSQHARSPRKRTNITEEQLDFLRSSLTDMRNLAKQMDSCFGEVTAVVAQQNKILTQCELSLAEAAKKMKKSKEVAKEAIRQKMQANKRDCFFSTIITLTIITGFGICFGYIWSLVDPEQ